jgi:hypothetical protein
MSCWLLVGSTLCEANRFTCLYSDDVSESQPQTSHHTRAKVAAPGRHVDEVGRAKEPSHRASNFKPGNPDVK